MASKLEEFATEIVDLVMAGKSYALIAKHLQEKRGHKTDGPAIYRWLKARQKKLLSRSLLVNPSQPPLEKTVEVVGVEKMPVKMKLLDKESNRSSQVIASTMIKDLSSTSELDRLMLQSAQPATLLGKKKIK